MQRVLLLSLCILSGIQAPMAEAQSPEACAGMYQGTYDGDFTGVVQGGFGTSNPGFCNPPPLGAFSLSFKGSFAEFFWQDVTRTQVSTVVCVLTDLSFEGKGSASAGGSTREFFVSGNMDLNTCTITGTWTMHGQAGGFTMTLVRLAPQVFWNTLNGDFSNASNWDPQQIPGAGQTAVFKQTQTYAVSFGNASTDKFLIEQGKVTFLAGSYAATGGSEVDPSAIVANSSLDDASLTLASHNLTTVFSTFARSPGAFAEVFIEDGSTWTEQGRMVIGQGGFACLSIGDSTATVTSLETQVGADASGNGLVNVSSNADWTTGNLAIGLRGKGAVNQFGGYIQSNSVVVGLETGSQGTATVGSAVNAPTWVLDGNLIVGGSGEGRLDIVEGGTILANAIIQVVVGQSEGGVGTICIDGAESQIFAPGSFVLVGADGSGLMSLRNGGEVICDFGIVTDHGVVRIEDSEWRCRESLNLHSGGNLEGNGYIVTPEANIEGTVAPGVMIEALKGLPNQNDSFGTLTFGGNVDFGSATLEIDIGGLAEGAYDVLHSTGAVDIQNATLLFSLVDGFLPRTGDTVPFLMAEDGVTVGNLVMEFEGVADGFLFEVMEEDGMLKFESLNDAQAIVQEPTPLPTALNPNADVTGDNRVDANDLLEVMRNWNRVVSQKDLRILNDQSN